MDLHAPSSVPSLDQQLQQYLRGAASRDRDVERIGPFLATFDPHSTIPYLSYAIPDDGARPTLADVAALVDAYARHDRVPRLEYLPVAAPDVEAVLLAGGFAVEARLAVMTCAVGDAVDLAPDDGIVIAPPMTDEDLRAMRAAQYAAFGEIVEEHARRTATTTTRARQTASAWPTAGSRCSLATSPTVRSSAAASRPSRATGSPRSPASACWRRHRRRGIAGAITAGLARAALRRGHDDGLADARRRGRASRVRPCRLHRHDQPGASVTTLTTPALGWSAARGHPRRGGQAEQLELREAGARRWPRRRRRSQRPDGVAAVLDRGQQRAQLGRQRRRRRDGCAAARSSAAAAPSMPSTSSSASWTSRISVAPSRSSALVPRERQLENGTRHRGHVAAEIERELGGDQRSGALGGLDDDRRRAPAPR